MPTKTPIRQIALSIADRHNNGGISYEEVLSIGKTRLRIAIKTDNFVFQKSATIERWDGDGWQGVHRLHYRAMKSNIQSYRSGDTRAWNDPKHFALDHDELLRVARAVLDI